MDRVNQIKPIRQGGFTNGSKSVGEGKSFYDGRTVHGYSIPTQTPSQFSV